PFVFALFGSTLALRVRRGSRGFGVLVSLIVLLIYYLVTIAGDQMARGGSLSPIIGAWMATGLTSVFAVLLLVARRRQISWFSRASTAAAVPPDTDVSRVSSTSHGLTRNWI